MQRIYNWLVISFLCILTVNFYNARNELAEVSHTRYEDNCTLYETYSGLAKRIFAIESAEFIRSIEPEVSAVYKKLQNFSVKVSAGSGSGSGVLFCREVEGKQRVFIWTAGHVVSRLRRIDGSFKNATIKMESRVRGKYVNEIESEAKVIAYSNQYTGEDLALLEIIKECAMFNSADFAGDEIQKVGTEVIHVGSTAGFYNSASLGIVSQTDREFRGKMYDQTSTMAYPGSSGGGAYTTDGKCIGLVTLGVGPGLNFYVPVRRMRAWAKKEGIEWAMDLSVPVPLSRTPTELEMTVRKPSIPFSVYDWLPSLLP